MMAHAESWKRDFQKAIEGFMQSPIGLDLVSRLKDREHGVIVLPGKTTKVAVIFQFFEPNRVEFLAANSLKTAEEIESWAMSIAGGPVVH